MVNTKRGNIDKLYKKFDVDLWGKMSITDKPSKRLDYLVRFYFKDYKIRRILRLNLGFFIPITRKRFMYSLSSNEREFHRKKRSIKINNYFNLLKLKQFYGNIKVRQFYKNFRGISSLTFVMASTFFYLLESRLDVILYRSNMFNSIYSARQFISHKGVLVNGKKVNISSYRANINSLIKLNVSTEDSLVYYNNLKERLQKDKILVNYPSYLEFDYMYSSFIFLKVPAMDEIAYPFSLNLGFISYNNLK